MEELYKLILLIPIGYFIGSIPFAYILTRTFKGGDITKIGSGNPGAANVIRSVGILPGVLTFILDFGKGFLCGYLGKMILGSLIGGIVCGFFSIIGHNWSIFLSFNGGKGVATSSGVIISIKPEFGFILLPILFLVSLLSRMSSLGSLTSFFILTAYVLTFDENLILKFAISTFFLLIVLRHKDNIKRLLKGEERAVW